MASVEVAFKKKNGWPQFSLLGKLALNKFNDSY